MLTTNSAARWWPCAIACVLLTSGCATSKPSTPAPLRLPVPTVSVDMPRPPEQILSDVEQTLSDLDLRQRQALQLLTP